MKQNFLDQHTAQKRLNRTSAGGFSIPRSLQGQEMHETNFVATEMQK